MKLDMKTENYKNSGIYQIINLCNNKVYIGSAYNFYNRYRQHLSTLKNCKHDNEHLQRSYLKYGSENFSFSIIELCTKQNLEEREQYHIRKHFGENCYNMNENVQCRHMNDRFNKNYILVSPDTKIFKHYGNLKTLAKTLSILDTNSSESQYYNGISQLINEKREHYKGWRLEKNINCDISIKKHKGFKGKVYNISITSPDGEEFDSITHLANFCKAHNISSSATFYGVLMGYIKSYKGWHLTGTKHQKWNSKIHDVIIESPEGIQYGPIDNLSKFAKSHGLSQGGLREFLIGKLKTYKNWKIIKPLEKEMNL